MLKLFTKPKTIDPNITYDEPQRTGITIDPRKKNYDFEIISCSVWDTDMNEYASKQQAVSKGVTENRLIIEEDFMTEDTCLAYRYEKNMTDKINLINAKKTGFGIIRMLTGDAVGREYMYCLHKTTRALNFAVYGYLTHGFVDGRLLKKIKKDKQLQNELRFVIEDINGDYIFNQIMNHSEK